MKSLLLRRAFKPAVFVLCLTPALWLLAGALQVGAIELGTNPIEKIQDTLGQWGLRFLVITLAITPLRDWSGATWLISLRRMLGLYAFFYVLMHFLVWLILEQGVLLDPSANGASVFADIAKRPFITLGFIALLLLVPLAITSTHGMMRRLGRCWKTLHRLIYPICLLAIWHYYWQVKADVREPLVYLGVIAVLLGWRGWKQWRKPAPAVRSAA
jgi:methionine sulfoxide reductase heme-binding subunit